MVLGLGRYGGGIVRQLAALRNLLDRKNPVAFNRTTVRLVLIGSCRGAEDEARVAEEARARPIAVVQSEAHDLLREVERETIWEAVAKGAFGAPTFVVGDALFWGHDLHGSAFRFQALGEDHLERHIEPEDEGDRR